MYCRNAAVQTGRALQRRDDEQRAAAGDAAAPAVSLRAAASCRRLLRHLARSTLPTSGALPPCPCTRLDSRDRCTHRMRAAGSRQALEQKRQTSPHTSHARPCMGGGDGQEEVLRGACGESPEKTNKLVEGGAGGALAGARSDRLSSQPAGQLAARGRVHGVAPKGSGWEGQY